MLKGLGVIVGTLVLMVIVYYGEKTGEWLKATVLEPPEPWNGTTLPIEKVPDWVKRGNARAPGNFADYSARDLINLPSYDLSILQFPDDQLMWDNRHHDYIRNAKITYPVVY